MKILFLCRHNRFRSKVAITIFEKMVSSDFKKSENSKNAETKSQKENITAESAGIIIDEARPYVAQIVIDLMKKKGYEIKDSVSRQITSNRINEFNLLIIVADNVDPEFFKSSGFKGKIIWWKVKDVSENDINGIKEKINEIEKRVKKLVKELSK